MSEKKTYCPFVHIGKEDVEIIGEPEGLDALGDMLKLKAKMGRKLSATMSDGVNKPIKITSYFDFLEERKEEFTFEGYARKIDGQHGKEISVWTDGLAVNSDNIQPCAYPLQEGERYKITIKMLPSEFCGDEK